MASGARLGSNISSATYYNSYVTLKKLLMLHSLIWKMEISIVHALQVICEEYKLMHGKCLEYAWHRVNAF